MKQRENIFFGMGRIRPQWKPGQDRPKNEIGPGPAQKPTSHKSGLGPAVRAGLSNPREQKAGYCAEHSNQLIIFICCRTWIAHGLHANEDNREEGDREREKITWNEGAWLLGWRWRRLGSPMELLYASSSRCRDTNLGVFSPPRRFAPLFVFFLLVFVFFCMLSTLSLFLFLSFSFPFLSLFSSVFFPSLSFFCCFHLLDGIVCLSRNLSSLSISPPSL